MKLRNSIKIFFAVIRALFLRELEMRFNSGRSGLFWTFFEPFIQLFVFIAIHVLITGHSGKAVHARSYDYTVFLASGFIAFNMFRHILNSTIGAFKANRGLFIYKQVKPIDTVIARVLLQLFLTSVIVLAFLFIGFFFQLANIFPKDVAMVLLGYLWLALFAFGVGLLVAVGNTFFMSIGKFVSIASFGLLILSAVFYPLSIVPNSIRNLLLYNPLVHFMEFIHGYYVYGLDTHFVDYRYMLIWTVTPPFLGLWLYLKLEKRIISE